jgi:patatin-like phospholipase/acyl hydrolase
MPYRILSLDGGGLRGLISAVLLSRLEAARPGFIASIDLFAGTSTGGILALGLAAGLPPGDIARLYEQHGADIFDDSLWDNLRDFGKSIGADYDNRRLAKHLRDIFGTRTLKDLPKRVVLCAFDLDNQAKPPDTRRWSPKIFHNFPGSDSDGLVPIVNAALYTSAAPTYFPSVDGYIDGGVFANNPSMVAIAQALDARNRPHAARSLDDIQLLSLGTGEAPAYIQGSRLNWGTAQWIKPLLQILMDGVSGIAHFQCAQILGDNYHRLQVPFAPREVIEMDDVKKLPRMRALAESQDLTPTLHWIQTCATER